MNRSPFRASAASTTGCRPPSISRHGWSVRLGAHHCPSAARAALPAATSIRAIASAVAPIRSAWATASAVNSSRCAASAASACAARLDHPARLGMQVGRIEPHHPGQGLAVGEAAVRHHQPVGVARGDFDMVAEHRIVPDLQRRDPGRVAILCLQRRNRPPPVAARAAKSVQCGVIPLGDITALGRVDRRLGHQRDPQPVGQPRMPAQIRQQRTKQWRTLLFSLKLFPQLRRAPQPVAQLGQVPRSPAARHQPAQRPRQIK